MTVIGVLVTSCYNMSHLLQILHVVCRFIVSPILELKHHDSTVIGALTAHSYLVGHPTICFTCKMSKLGRHKDYIYWLSNYT